MRWLLPIVLIGVALGGFFLITSPIYNDILALQKQSDVYEQALQNSASLQKERDRLTNKFNSFSQEDLTKLEKMLPNSVDNIQLILEMQQEASKRGIIVKNVQFSPEQFLNQNADKSTATSANTSTPVSNSASAQSKAANTTSTTNRTGRVASADDNKDYEAFELEFSVEGAYKDFVAFMELMERSLRLIDINSISFTPGTSEKDKKYSDNYKYLFKINTYRLKD